MKPTIRVHSFAAVLILAAILHMSGGIVWSIAVSSPQSAVLPFPWRFQEVCQLDTESEEALVGEYEDSAVSSEGFTYLVSSVTNRSSFRGIHVFDATGAWVGNIGREGEGPGEFRGVSLIACAPDGKLLVYDPYLDRISILTADGTYLDSFLAPRAMISGIGHAGGGAVWTVSKRPIPPRVTPPWQQEFMRVNMAAEVTERHVFTDVSDVIVQDVPGRPGLFTMFPHPGGRVAHWTPGPDGSLWVISPDYGTLHRYGGTVPDWQVQLSLSPVQMGHREWQGFLEARLSRLRESEHETQRESAQGVERELRRLDGVLAPTQELWWVDEAGLLLDRVPRDPRAESWWKGSGRYMALDWNGRVSEEVAGPGAAVAVENGYMLCIGSSPTDLPILTLYRLVPVSKGG